MNTGKVLYPSLFHLSHLQIDGLELVPFEAHTPLAPEHFDAVGVFNWMYPKRLWLQHLPEMPNLRFFQTLSAGVDHLQGLPFASSTQVLNSPHIHDQAVSEHALAGMLSIERNLHLSRDLQQQARWHRFGNYGTLQGQRVLIWGFGRIGQRLAQLLQAFGAQVSGVRHQASHQDGIHIWAASDIEQALAQTDWLVMILPRTTETAQVLNADRLACLPKGAKIANLGRGNAIDLEALSAALQSEHIAAAYLDVCDPEPLPSQHPLWSQPNLILTPHAGAESNTLEQRLELLISENLQRFTQGLPMLGVVDMSKGY